MIDFWKHGCFPWVLSVKFEGKFICWSSPHSLLNLLLCLFALSCLYNIYSIIVKVVPHNWFKMVQQGFKEGSRMVQGGGLHT